MQDLKVTLIQTPLHWEDITANLAMLEEKIWQIKEPTDLIILPEMFTTGFTMNASKLGEVHNLSTFKWMKQMAAQTGAVITGSHIAKDQDKYFNRLIWMEPDGSYSTYDKRHLFRMAKENETYSGGNNKIIKEIKGWKVLPLICYDLRFPVWSRRTIKEDYDLLIYVANWPEKRESAWNILLKARAVENLSYVVGVNRVGEDGNNIFYSGDSSVIDFKGEVLFTKKNLPFIKTITLSKKDLVEFREKFPAHLDADQFEIR